MTDFDAVLERLVADPGFADALTRDPDAALAGYRLSTDERELLRAQLSRDAGGTGGVESRTSKASLFGLLSPLGGGLGEVAGGGPAGHGVAGGGPAGHGVGGGGPAGHGVGGGGPAGHGVGGGGPAGHGATGHGPAVGSGPPGGSAGLGRGGTSGLVAGGTSGSGHGGAPSGLGGGSVHDAPVAPFAGFGGGGQGPVAEHLGDGLYRSGAAGSAETVPPVVDYRTRLDADGDGRWDAYTAHHSRDGGVDLHVDTDRDGRVDAVFHDADRDGLVESARYDADGDGRLETHARDTDGDGWLDRTSTEPPERLTPRDDQQRFRSSG